MINSDMVEFPKEYFVYKVGEWYREDNDKTAIWVSNYDFVYVTKKSKRVKCVGGPELRKAQHLLCCILKAKFGKTYDKCYALTTCLVRMRKDEMPYMTPASNGIQFSATKRIEFQREGIQIYAYLATASLSNAPSAPLYDKLVLDAAMTRFDVDINGMRISSQAVYEKSKGTVMLAFSNGEYWLL